MTEQPQERSFKSKQNVLLNLDIENGVPGPEPDCQAGQGEGVHPGRQRRTQGSFRKYCHADFTASLHDVIFEWSPVRGLPLQHQREGSV